jgi:hypothetical protein
MARRLLFVSAASLSLVLVAGPALACGGLIGPRGSVNLLRTTTLAAYHDGVERYMTAFQFVGTGGGKFGSLVPLPGIPTKVEKGGGWTLQRLEREVAPPPTFALDAVAAPASAGRSAKVILETRIDALDITVLKGGALEVGTWARDNGFDLPPDAPQVLDFYARRSPIFMAARFNLKAAQARGAQQGDGTPVLITIPTKSPWVPLRILSLGKDGREQIDADVFLLTDRAPSMLPAPVNAVRNGFPVATGITQNVSEAASDLLLTDLRKDKNMGWVPRSAWLTFLRLDAPAATLGYDLAIDASGAAQPSWADAGFVGLREAARKAGSGGALLFAIGLACIAAAAAVVASSGRRATVA